MFTLVVAPFFILYCFLAVVFVRRVFRKTNSRRSRIFSIALAALLPTWDVVLSILALPFAIIFWSDYKVIQQVEATSICYKSYMCNHVVINNIKHANGSSEVVSSVRCSVTAINNKHFDYSESFIDTEFQNGKARNLQNSTIYKCSKVQSSPGVKKISTKCDKVEMVSSQYLLLDDTYSFLKITLYDERIIDRISDSIVGLRRDVAIYSYANFLGIPFFDWLGWRHRLYSSSPAIFIYPGKKVANLENSVFRIK